MFAVAAAAASALNGNCLMKAQTHNTIYDKGPVKKPLFCVVTIFGLGGLNVGLCCWFQHSQMWIQQKPT